MAPKQGAKASTKAGRKPFATVPDQYLSKSDVKLSYFTNLANETTDPLEDDAWTELAIDNRSKVSVEFDGRVIIKQGDNKAVCTLTLHQHEYHFWGIKSVPKERETLDPITVGLKIREVVPPVTFGGKEPEKAREFPLARHHTEFLYIRLAIPFFSLSWIGGTSPRTAAARIGHLTVLMTGQISHDTQSQWHDILHKDATNLHEETRAQEEQLGLFKGCRLKTRKGKHDMTVIVEVYATKPADLTNDDEIKQYDFDKKIGLSYWITGSQLFPNDEDLLAEYKIMGSLVTAGWELVIVKDAEVTDAAMVGTIRNSLGHDVDRFIGEDTNVILEPIFNDVLGDRSRRAVRNVRKEVDEFSMKARGFFEAELSGSEEKRPKSQLPGLTLFGDQMCNDEENALSGDFRISPELVDLLNEPQRNFLDMMLCHKVSIVWGPPGTGKSMSLAALFRQLLTTSDEKFVGTAMANVAVDALLHSCVQLWSRFAKDGSSPPVARIFSEAQIESQWKAGEYDTLSNEFHIDQLRFKKASRAPERWSKYLEGRRQLKECGIIVTKDAYEGYIEQAKVLTADIVDNDIRGVFCTVAGCQTPALYQADPSDGKIKRSFKATTIVNDEASTSLRPHVMLLAMTFLHAKRLVLAGDFKQLSALLLTAPAKKWWSPSFLQKLKEHRRWPYTLLDIQYRMHDALYDHLIAYVYKTPIRSHYATTNPSVELQKLLASMPLRVSTTRNSWELNSFMHFIDIRGEQITKPGGSSSNVAEVEYISALVKVLVQSGRSKKSICVMTGYADQTKLLQRTANNDGWNDIKRLVTFDSSQGSECNYIIISMVATQGHCSFMAKLQRACVLSSRQKEGIFFVGDAGHWFSPTSTGYNLLHKMLVRMRDQCKDAGRPSFIVRAEDRMEEKEEGEVLDVEAKKSYRF